MNENIRDARKIAKQLMGAAIAAFPDYAAINFYDLAGEERVTPGQDLTHLAETARLLTDWLAREGYLETVRKTERGSPDAGIRITAKGLALSQIDLFGP